MKKNICGLRLVLHRVTPQPLDIILLPPAFLRLFLPNPSYYAAATSGPVY